MHREQTEFGLEDKIVAGVANWITCRTNLVGFDFKQVYSHYIDDTCNQLQSIAAEHQKCVDELSPLDHRKLKLKLVACEMSHESKVRAKVKATMIKGKCKNKL